MCRSSWKESARSAIGQSRLCHPQFHTSRGIPFEAVIDGILEGQAAGQRDFSIASNLIMCLNRERTAASAFEMLEQAQPYRNQIIGLGMDSYEEHNFPLDGLSSASPD